jgi:23S rRNA pseudouridine1911/1915/1917 synthase
MSENETITVAAEHEGARLDRALEAALPDAGLRLRRRLCDEGKVLVDGRSRKPGYKVRTGQRVEINGREVAVTHGDLGLRVVERSERFAAIFKPGGVHSAAIAGKDSPSAEEALPGLLPGTSPVLLNRLDYLTSGLLLVALDPEGAQGYQTLEQAGDIRKFYLAEVRGRLDGVVTVKSRLDVDDRRTTRVLDQEDGDARRWTDVEVLSHDHDRDTTLVRCLIVKGARHQIRAHLAGLGHPIVGDPLYGGGKEGEQLMLRHYRVEFPGFRAEIEAAF